MTDEQEPILEVTDLNVEFGSAGLFKRGALLRAVRDVSFNLRSGETLGIVGESGSGKSTTARAITRLVPTSSGQVTLDGRDVLGSKGEELRRIRRDIQMVFQDPYSSLNPRRTVGASIAQPLLNHKLASRHATAPIVADLLQQVGLPADAARRYPHEFSGGQRQRVGIARAMATDPKVLICDEPVSALDISIQAQVVNLLGDLQERTNVGMLFIAHDLSVVRHVSHRVAVMYLGSIVEIGTSEEVYEATAHPYTMALLDSAPLTDPEHERERERITVSGEIPSAAHPPTGCAFHTRCWLYEQLGQPEQCRVQSPALAERSPRHRAACHFSDEAADRRPEPVRLPVPTRRRFEV